MMMVIAMVKIIVMMTKESLKYMIYMLLEVNKLRRLAITFENPNIPVVNTFRRLSDWLTADKLFLNPLPVSYTHLDVYKRQRNTC